MSPSAPTPRVQRKTLVGTVVSDRMMKTIVVRVKRLVRHPAYGRVVTLTSSFKAHDEERRAKVGDWVKIMETRPISKDKRWRLVDVLKRASQLPEAATEGPQAQPQGGAPRETAMPTAP